MNIGDLTVKIGADNVELISKVDSSKAAIGSLDDKVKSGAATFGKYAGAAIAAATALGTALVVQSFKAIDAQNDLAQKLDTTSTSLANMQRAGGLAGVEMGQIAASARMLTLNLSKAATDGAGPAHDALQRLNLSGAELAAMPLDQRIATINTALQQFVPAAQQASVAADLFGAKNAAAMMQLNADAIAQAAHEVQVLGLNLSEVDAAKVAAAADSLDVFGMAIDGIGQQLAVQFAPLLDQISKDFFEATEAAGGMGTVGVQVFNQLIEAASFTADAADGVGRVFELTAKGIVVAFQTVVTTVGGAITTLVTTADDALQAIGIESLGDKAQQVRDKFDQHMGTLKVAAEDFNHTLERPLAGERFKQYVADAQAASQEAAAAMAAGGGAAAGPAAGPTEARFRGGSHPDR
jgi:hypothetical protein